MFHPRWLTGAFLLLAACGGDPTGADGGGPPLARYHVAYTYQYPGPFGGVFDGADSVDFALTFASADSIAGHSFGTAGQVYQPLQLGFWNGDAYAVWAVTQFDGFPGPTLRLRVNRAGTTCSGRVQFLNGSNYALTTCAMSRR